MKDVKAIRDWVKNDTAPPGTMANHLKDQGVSHPGVILKMYGETHRRYALTENEKAYLLDLADKWEKIANGQ